MGGNCWANMDIHPDLSFKVIEKCESDSAQGGGNTGSELLWPATNNGVWPARANRFTTLVCIFGIAEPVCNFEYSGTVEAWSTVKVIGHLSTNAECAQAAINQYPNAVAAMLTLTRWSDTHDTGGYCYAFTQFTGHSSTWRNEYKSCRFGGNTWPSRPPSPKLPPSPPPPSPSLRRGRGPGRR